MLGRSHGSVGVGRRGGTVSTADELEPIAQVVENLRVGEDSQTSGEDGLHGAKLWLDKSTRTKTVVTSKDRWGRNLLAFRWPHGETTFSYDIGGSFIGGDIHGQSFLGEVKKYKAEGDLGTLFRDFLAKSYVALSERENDCDNFLWISWAPFQARSWDKHCTYDNVVRSLKHGDNLQRGLGASTAEEADGLIDPQVAQRVANRVWLITLSDRQEDLYLLDEHYGEIVKKIAMEGVGR
jgi:hypothetical protein